MGLKAGQPGIAIKLQSGILVTGKVFARGTDTPVPNATIRFDNINPPKDTALTRSGADGTYGVRLKPGDYLYEAIGRSYRSPVKLRLPVTGEYPGMDVSLYVAGKGTLSGQVMDAVSGDPIPNARVMLEFGGTPSALGRTGTSGSYTLDGIAGENVVRFMSAPGYLPPANPSLSFHLDPREEIAIPTFWLMPLPTYTLEVIDNTQQPVDGAIVSVLRPRQWGWRTTDTNGLAELAFAHLPNDGRVIGMIEHPNQPVGALFSISKDRADDAIMKLNPLASVSGTVKDEDGTGLEGVAVQAYFGDENMDTPILLRQTISRKNGEFTLEGIPMDIPLVYSTNSVSPPSVHTATTLNSQIPTPLLAIANLAGKSMAGNPLRWRSMTYVGGKPFAHENMKDSPTIVIFTDTDQAAATLESLVEIKRILNHPTWAMVLVIDGSFHLDSPSVSLFQGARPGMAMTYVLDKTGIVVFETNSLPPLTVLQRLDN